MTARLQRMVLVVSMSGLLVPGVVSGQPVRTAVDTGVLKGPLTAASISFWPPSMEAAGAQPLPGGMSATSKGVIIGASIGAGAAIAAVVRTGAGKCGSCYVQVSVVAVPVGAAIGGTIGRIIDRRRRVTVAPLIARSAAGLAVSVRF